MSFNAYKATRDGFGPFFFGLGPSSSFQNLARAEPRAIRAKFFWLGPSPSFCQAELFRAEPSLEPLFSEKFSQNINQDLAKPQINVLNSKLLIQLVLF